MDFISNLLSSFSLSTEKGDTVKKTNSKENRQRMKKKREKQKLREEELKKKKKEKAILAKKRKLKREAIAKEASLVTKASKSVDEMKTYELIDLSDMQAKKFSKSTVQLRNRKPIDAAKKVVNAGYYTYFGLRLMSNKFIKKGIIRFYIGSYTYYKNPAFDSKGQLLESYKKKIRKRTPKKDYRYDKNGKVINRYKIIEKTIPTILYLINKIRNSDASNDVKRERLAQLKEEYDKSRQKYLENRLFLKKTSVKNESLVKDENGKIITSLNMESEYFKNLQDKIIKSAMNKNVKKPPQYPTQWNNKSVKTLEKNNQQFIRNMFEMKKK